MTGNRFKPGQMDLKAWLWWWPVLPEDYLSPGYFIPFTVIFNSCSDRVLCFAYFCRPKSQLEDCAGFR